MASNQGFFFLAPKKKEGLIILANPKMIQPADKHTIIICELIISTLSCRGLGLLHLPNFVLLHFQIDPLCKQINPGSQWPAGVLFVNL
jgi:hypothetical protein